VMSWGTWGSRLLPTAFRPLGNILLLPGGILALSAEVFFFLDCGWGIFNRAGG